MDKKILTLLIIIAFLALGGGAYLFFQAYKGPQPAMTSAPEETLPAPTETPVPQNRVLVENQAAGEIVVVSEAEFINSGFIVIHEDSEGAPGTVLGNSNLLMGVNTDVEIKLTRKTTEGETLYAMLHQDNGDGEYEFPGPDIPLTDESGSIVISTFKIGETLQDEVSNVIDLTSGNFFFNPSQITVRAGTVTVNVSQNTGIHTFVVEGLNVKENLQSGKTFIFEAKPGLYEFYCDVSDHKARGMIGTLNVL